MLRPRYAHFRQVLVLILCIPLKPPVASRDFARVSKANQQTTNIIFFISVKQFSMKSEFYVRLDFPIAMSGIQLTLNLPENDYDLLEDQN